MKNILLAITFLIAVPFSVINAQSKIEFEGITLPRTIKFQDQTLSLNGAGTRSKMWVEVYIQALYLSQLSQDAQYIIDNDTEMAIRIQITSSLVSSGKFTRALYTGFEKSAGENFNDLKSRIELLKSMLSENIKGTDVFNLIYSPIDKSVWVYKNDELKGKIPGFDFQKAFFGIWLSDKPVDEELKKSLLGI